VPTSAARIRRNRALGAFEAARDSGLGIAHRADWPLGRATRNARPGGYRQECFAGTVAAAADGNAESVLTHFIDRAGVGFAATAAIFPRGTQVDLAAIARFSVAVGEARFADERSVSAFTSVRAAGVRACAPSLTSAIRSAAQGVSTMASSTMAASTWSPTARAAFAARGSSAAQVMLIARGEQRARGKHAAREQANEPGRAKSQCAAARFRRGRHALAGTGGSTSARKLAE